MEKNLPPSFGWGVWRRRGGEQCRVASVTDGVGTSGDVIVRGRRAQVASRAAVTGGVEGGEAAGADG